MIQANQAKPSQNYIWQTIQWYAFIIVLNGIFIGLYVFALKTKTDIYQYVFVY